MLGMKHKTRSVKKKHVSEGVQVTHLVNAIELSDIKKIKGLLKQGAPINKASLFGRTPLATATARGNVEVIKILLRNNADPDLASGLIGDRTPLQIAALKGDLNILRILLNYGADPRDQKAITLALKNGNITFAQRLCDILGQDLPVLEKATQEQNQRDDAQAAEPQESWFKRIIKTCCSCDNVEIEWDEERKYI